MGSIPTIAVAPAGPAGSQDASMAPQAVVAPGFAGVLAEAAGQGPTAWPDGTQALFLTIPRPGQGIVPPVALEEPDGGDDASGEAAETAISLASTLATALGAVAAGVPQQDIAAGETSANVPVGAHVLPVQAQAGGLVGAAERPVLPEQSAAPAHAAVATPNLGASAQAESPAPNGQADPRANALSVLETVPASARAIEAVSAAAANNQPPVGSAVATANPVPPADVQSTAAPPNEASPPDIPTTAQDSVVRLVGNAQETVRVAETTGEQSTPNSNGAVVQESTPAAPSGADSETTGEQSTPNSNGAVVQESMATAPSSGDSETTGDGTAQQPASTPDSVVTDRPSAGTFPDVESSPEQAGARTPSAEPAPAIEVPVASNQASPAAGISPIVGPPGVPTAAAPATAHLATPATAQVAAPPPSEQIAQAVIEQLVPDGGEVTLRLDPPELGEVTIRMTVTANRVGLEATVERPEALALLRQNQEALSQLLRDSGLQLADVFVDLQQGHSQGGDSQQRANAPDPNASGNFAAILNGDEDDQLAHSRHAALQAAYNPDGSLLYRV